MKNYIVYSLDGWTEDLLGEPSENSQVLGIFEAETSKDAAEKCRSILRERKHIFEELFVRELLNDELYYTHGVFEDDEMPELDED